MALDWSKSKQRDQRNAARGNEAELARMLADDVPQPSKADQRAMAEAAMGAFMGNVTRLPTMIDLKCVCGHRKRVAIAHGRARPRFKCSRCGTRL